MTRDTSSIPLDRMIRCAACGRHEIGYKYGCCQVCYDQAHELAIAALRTIDPGRQPKPKRLAAVLALLTGSDLSYLSSDIGFLVDDLGYADNPLALVRLLQRAAGKINSWAVANA